MMCAAPGSSGGARRGQEEEACEATMRRREWLPLGSCATLSVHSTRIDRVTQDEDDDDDAESPVRPEHFYHFKTYFTAAEAAKLIEGVKKGGAFTKAFEVAVSTMLADDEDDDDEDELVRAFRPLQHHIATGSV